MASKINYEAELQNQLDFAGYNYIREYEFHPDRKWRCDFFLPAFSLIIEVEGVSYRGSVGRHQRGVGFQNDAEKYNSLVLMGYRLLRFTPAMVSGKARRTTKGRTLMEPAIDIIDQFCLGSDYFTLDRSKELYARGHGRFTWLHSQS